MGALLVPLKGIEPKKTGGGESESVYVLFFELVPLRIKKIQATPTKQDLGTCTS